ncbi:MAG: DUF1287 domain-containing protein [Actinomycetota bacterium]|nr:MAG: DUF1287 domain-containing protein [Actinomycetota bacterium]
MKSRAGKTKFTRILNYRYFIYAGIIIALLQFWTLKSFYEEQQIIKLPDDLFGSPVEYPLSELTLEYIPGSTDTEPAGSAGGEDDSSPGEQSEAGEDGELDGEDTAIDTEGAEIEGLGLSDIQKQIVLKLLELIQEDITYGYEVFPDSGYPTNNVWISTDVISIVLNESGFDLMELIYKDMSEHKEDYPMDIKGRKQAIKYLDFRDVFFQEQFFRRHALELPLEYEAGDPNNVILWQPGDILYFQFDPDNPYKDLGGFVSPHKNEDGIPLVTMISAELGTVSETDVLGEYEIVGHFRYPQPDID